MSEPGNEKMTLTQAFFHMARGIGIIKTLFPWYLTLSSLASVISAIQPLIVLFFSARIIDEITGERDVSQIALYAGIAVGSNFIFRIIGSLISRRIETLGNTNWQMLRQFMGKHYARMDYEYVENSSVNELLANILAKQNANGLGILRLYWFLPDFVERFCGLIASTAMLAGMFGSMAKVTNSWIASSWATALLAALVISPLILRILLMKRTGRVMQEVFKLLPRVNTLFQYYFHYIQTDGAGKDIRIYHQQPSILAIMNDNKFTWMSKMSRMESETSSITAAANAVVSGFTYLLIGLRALAGMYSIGQVTQYVGAVTYFSGSLTGLISACAMQWENAPYLSMLYIYLDLPDVKYNGSLTTEKRTDNEYELEFHNVFFKYPGTAQYALRDLNLKLNIGERLAVVGMNGSGKTTMIKLLCRLYDPTEGHITLNGIDIRKYDYDEYIGIFSVVFQDFKLSSFPLGQNVAAAIHYNAERVWHSLNKTGFNERTAELPDGMDTALYKDFDEGGVMISCGEAQKIALARAIYKDAPFIILDEPTAALDPIAEYEIYTKFDSIVGNKTAVYISHRLSSCRFCHDIAVFHEGKLIQRGSHDELVKDPSGKYYELWNAQAQYYTETGNMVDGRISK